MQRFRYTPANGKDVHSFDAISIADGDFFEALQWCIDMFGRQEVGKLRWAAGNFRINIAQDDDAFAFRMRWC